MKCPGVSLPRFSTIHLFIIIACMLGVVFSVRNWVQMSPGNLQGGGDEDRFVEVLLVLFWNHDLGFHDFDLFIAPLTLMNLLWLRATVEVAEKKYGASRNPLILGALAATSAFSLILAITTFRSF